MVNASAPQDRRPLRVLAAVCAGLVLAWGLLAAGSAALVGLLAVAGVAAVIATGGPARRLVGLLLAGAGVAVLLLGPHPPSVVGGAGAMVVVGLFVLVAEPKLARVGGRYAATRRSGAEPDPDRAAWGELDAGRDPTGDGGPGPG